jgi:hypothetical protein
MFSDEKESGLAVESKRDITWITASQVVNQNLLLARLFTVLKSILAIVLLYVGGVGAC